MAQPSQLMNGVRADLLRGVLIRALNAWWLFAAFATLLALVAFPLYKGVILGYVPVAIGVAMAIGVRFLPSRITGNWTEILYRTPAKTWLAVVLSLGFAARAVATALPPIPFSDHATYLEVGRRIAAGNGFGDSILYPPGPSVTVAFAIWLLGDEVHLLAAFHASLGLITVAVLYFGLRKYSEQSARWSSLVAALWPSLVVWNSTLGHETTALLLYVVICLLAMRLTRDLEHQWLTCVAVGFLSGTMALVRPTAVVMPGLIAIAVWICGQSIRRAVVKGIVVAIVMVATVSPWTIRNYLKFDEFLLISANSGKVLLSSNHPQSDGIYHTLAHIPELNAIQRDRLRAQQAWSAIAADPMRFAALTVKRIVFMWGTDTSGLDFVLGQPPRGGDTAKKALSFLLQVPWAALAIAWVVAAWTGATRDARDPLNWVFITLWVAVLWVTHALVEPLSRHHLPLVPLIAAIVLPRYWEWVTSRPIIRFSKK